MTVDVEPFREGIVDALTTICGRCDGKGTESWQVSRDPADGREDWPCNRCKGAKTITDRHAVARVMAVIAAVLDPSDDAAWCCEECGEPWAPLPDRPGQCRRCGNRTRLPCPTKTSPNAAQEYL